MARENKISYIGFRETKTYKEKIEKEANKKDMNVSEFIKYCIEKEIVERGYVTNGE